jgi:hypothetical protein
MKAAEVAAHEALPEGLVDDKRFDRCCASQSQAC